MLICQGDGELMINPNDGHVVWAGICTPLETWCREKGYVRIRSFEGALDLDLSDYDLPLPSCKKCTSYKDCCSSQESKNPDQSDCSAVDEEALGKSILAALSKLDKDFRKEILG